jgi:hypothetical protein
MASKYEFGNVKQIKQAKAAVKSAEIGKAFDHLHIVLCEKETLSESEDELLNHVLSLSCDGEFGLTDGYN